MGTTSTMKSIAGSIASPPKSAASLHPAERLGLTDSASLTTPTHRSSNHLSLSSTRRPTTRSTRAIYVRPYLAQDLQLPRVGLVRQHIHRQAVLRGGGARVALQEGH